MRGKGVCANVHVGALGSSAAAAAGLAAATPRGVKVMVGLAASRPVRFPAGCAALVGSASTEKASPQLRHCNVSPPVRGCGVSKGAAQTGQAQRIGLVMMFPGPRH